MTVREWFRVVRRAGEPRLVHPWQRDTVFALRAGDWAAAEFHALLWLSTFLPKPGDHDWVRSADGYSWVCRRCPASVPSEEIDEEAPDPKWFDPGCECAACRPCRGGD